MSEREIVLTSEEAVYLLRLITEPMVYYRTLAGSEKCSAGNKERHEMLEVLWGKLK